MNKTQIPVARMDGLVIQEMPDELLVYDLETNKAHCLNQTASTVWKACNGENTIAEIASLFENENEDLVWLAIDQLYENNLLEKAYELDLHGRTRRDLIKKIGLASVVALPVVASLTAPSSVMASTSCTCSDGSPLTCQAQTGCQTTCSSFVCVSPIKGKDSV